MVRFLLIGVIVLTVSESAWAWGLATHVALAETLLSELATVATCGAGLILARRRDFLWGNVLADVIVGKKLSKRRRLSHHWPAGQRLLRNARDDRSKAFAYGFLSHLAADTVAHNAFVPHLIEQTGSTITLGHLYWELRADRLIEAEHRTTIRRLLRTKHPHHEQTLADTIFPELRWFGLNRSVFTRVNRLTHVRPFGKAFGFCEDLSQWALPAMMFQEHRDEAVQRMLEVVTTGGRSKITQIDPNGHAALRTLKGRR